MPARNAPQPPHFFLNDLLDDTLLFRRHPPDDRLVDVENRGHCPKTYHIRPAAAVTGITKPVFSRRLKIPKSIEIEERNTENPGSISEL